MNHSVTLLALILLASGPLAARAAAPDRDGDGVPDDRDQCPDEPEDRDGFQDEDGCPDPDNDRDGIPDVDDKCPNEPETVNGYQDEDGCPDRPPVQIRRDHPPIVTYLFFPEGRAEIVKSHRNLLAEIAAVMKANPKVTLVEVQGHADDPGGAAVNNRLSQRRAEVARLALVKLGVAPTRLVAKGYGQKQPLGKGRTTADRARNRRVAFQALKPAPPAK